MRYERIVSPVLLSIGLASLGFGLGGGVSAELMTRSGSRGLEGAATVAVWALSGAIVGLVTAVCLTFRLAPPSRQRIARMAFIMGMVALAFFLWRGHSR